MFACVLSFCACACSAVLWFCICPASACSLMLVAGGYSRVVDLYNSVTGEWSTALLSLGRIYIQAASVGNLALFAGGEQPGGLLRRECVRSGEGLLVLLFACVLSVCARACSAVLWFCICPASACSLMRAAAGAQSNVVDLYNSATGAWSTAQLSLARQFLSATSVGNVAMFAGGYSGALL